jgi:hypothetical protein
MITKYASAAQRSTVDTCRTLIIWCVQLALGKEKFLAGELFGFFILVLGTLVYNEIIEIPLTFMYRNTKRNIRMREELREDILANNTKNDMTKSESITTPATAASGQASEFNEDDALLANKKFE